MSEFPRPPLLDETNLSSEQQAVFDAIRSGPRGVVEGPLRVWLQSAELADKAQAPGAFWKSGFEWAVHAPIAVRSGLAKETVEAIRTGIRPAFAEQDEAIVYDFASELHRDHAVSDATYGRACAAFGIKAVVELVGLLGYYTLISMTINAFEVPLPDQATDPFP